jgi:type II secretory pathway component PulF
MKRMTLIIFGTLLLGIPVFLLIYLYFNGEDVVWDIATVMLTFMIVAIAIGILSAIIYLWQSAPSMRRRRAAVVLTYLDQAVRLNLPLPQLLEAAAASERGVTASRMRRLRDLLDKGLTVSVALDNAVPEISPRILALIAAGERSGRLPQALEQLANEARNNDPRETADRTFISIYPVMMTLAIFFIVSLVMVVVVPKFKKIFEDFHVELPYTTKLLIAVSHALADSGAIVVLVVIILAIPLIRLATDRFGIGRKRRWNWPIGWLTRDRDLADVCNVIADSLDSAMPLDSAIRAGCDLSIGSMLRRKLDRWAGAIESGMTAADAGRAAGMPKLIVGLTGTGEVASAEQAFRFLSRYYATRFSRLAQLARGAVVPVMVFIFGAVVGMVALGLYLPMISLISAVSNSFNRGSL